MHDYRMNFTGSSSRQNNAFFEPSSGREFHTKNALYMNLHNIFLSMNNESVKMVEYARKPALKTTFNTDFNNQKLLVINLQNECTSDRMINRSNCILSDYIKSYKCRLKI